MKLAILFISVFISSFTFASYVPLFSININVYYNSIDAVTENDSNNVDLRCQLSVYWTNPHGNYSKNIDFELLRGKKNTSMFNNSPDMIYQNLKSRLNCEEM
jgi:hypothetical protein